jgi:hypothetical protein
MPRAFSTIPRHRNNLHSERQKKTAVNLYILNVHLSHLVGAPTFPTTLLHYLHIHPKQAAAAQADSPARKYSAEFIPVPPSSIPPNTPSPAQPSASLQWEYAETALATRPVHSRPFWLPKARADRLQFPRSIGNVVLYARRSESAEAQRSGNRSAHQTEARWRFR